jgi:DNA-binding MarR family transcriptional regulator
VVNSVPEDAQLEQLLTQLLRAVFPAFPADRPEPGAGGSPVDGPVTDLAANSTYSDDALPAPALPKEYGVPVPDMDGRPVDRKPAPMLPSVSASEARALIELMSARGIAQGELANLLGLEKSTVSRLAAGLERKGWIRRGRDDTNQRYVRLYLTEHGRDVATRVWRAWQTRQARVLAGLSADERAGLSAGLRGLVRGLAAEGLLGESKDGSPAPRGDPS